MQPKPSARTESVNHKLRVPASYKIDDDGAVFPIKLIVKLVMIHVQIKSEQKFTLYKCSCHKPGSDVPKKHISSF